MMLFIVLSCVALVAADLYMHNPRGSNDRNCERNENRNNGNRLFDSQNNDKGGYACPRAWTAVLAAQTPEMYYYGNSHLTIEWTNQHACGETNDCQIIIQYMCADYYVSSANVDVSYLQPTDPSYDLVNTWIRDGTPAENDDTATDRMNPGEEADTAIGYHESEAYYTFCSTKTRNTGVWIADQNVRINGPSTVSRQNPNGNRYGWECTEERDYYPYWHPSPWKDIAVLTTNKDDCKMYQRESQNVKDKYWCRSKPAQPSTTNPNPNPRGDFMSFNSYTDCLAGGGLWVKVPHWNIDPPACVSSVWSRNNHLGNTYDNQMANFNWTIPNDLHLGLMDRCVLRMRYNISTAETQWGFDARQNGKNSPIKQDPYAPYAGYNLSMAVNTDQYGRTFQDRSYVFGIKKWNNHLATGQKIWNVNVRGKRGNIVQTYPAMEYDFVPQQLHIKQNDYVHFQWTGSDYNPNRQPNNGEGGPSNDANNYGADRHNVFPDRPSYAIGETQSDSWFKMMTHEQMMSLVYINQPLSGCHSYSTLLLDNGGQDNNDLRSSPFNCMTLSTQLQPYFDLGPVKFTKTGHFHYMSTRNNNFSNRQQKAAIYVAPLFTPGQIAGIVLGTFAAAGLIAGGSGYAYARKYPNGRVAGVMNMIHSHLPSFITGHK